MVVDTEVWDSIGFGWVIDFRSQQHMLFPLPSHSLLSQPPWSKETNKWHTRLVVMWTKKKTTKKKGRRIEDEEKGKNKRRVKIKIRQDNAFYKHRDRNSYSKDRAGQGWVKPSKKTSFLCSGLLKSISKCCWFVVFWGFFWWELGASSGKARNLIQMS